MPTIAPWTRRRGRPEWTGGAACTLTSAEGKGRARARKGKKAGAVGGDVGSEKTARAAIHLGEAWGDGQGNKGVWWMPRRFGPKKDAASCEKPRGAAHRR